MFNGKRLIQSFYYAMQGLKYVWKHEQNFRVQVLIGMIVVVGMFVFQVTVAEAIVLTMLIIFVLVLELVNTIFEKMVDILKPRIHSYVKSIKDMMAAAVFIAALGSSIVAIMIFLPYLLDLFNQLLYN